MHFVTLDDGSIVLLWGSADALRHITGANVKEIVGEIAMGAATLEINVEIIICRLANLTDEQSRIFFGGAMLDTKLTILRELAEIRLRRRPKPMAELKKLIEDLRLLNTSRKIAIHGGWISWRTREDAMRGVEKFKTTAIKRAKGNKQNRLNVEEAISIAKRISAQTYALVMFVKKTWPRLPPMRGTSLAKPRDNQSRAQKSPKRK